MHPLFSGGILHRDISPNNIIVIDDSLPAYFSFFTLQPLVTHSPGFGPVTHPFEGV
ncbi:hypothetical protein BGX38DRAFT_1246805 [Terfezia claveryi]|nr:hypothetical protein BGX38DRAFT_1246805 [Terfezia claveryi]